MPSQEKERIPKNSLFEKGKSAELVEKETKAILQKERLSKQC